MTIRQARNRNKVDLFYLLKGLLMVLLMRGSGTVSCPNKGS